MRYNYEDIKKYFEENGYKLISKEYKNFNTILESICPKGHQYCVRFKNFKAGRRCPKCRMVTFEKVKHVVEVQGYQLLTQESEYTNTRMSLTVQCPNGHITKRRYDSFLAKNNCRECTNDEKRKDFSIVKKYIEKAGFILLDKQYKNSYTPLNVQCKNGHVSKMTYNCLKQGDGCRECLHDTYRKKYDDVKKIIEERGYTLISKEYLNARQKLHLKCSNGHDYHVSLGMFHWNHNDCPKCNSIRNSKGEEIIESILIENNVEYKKQHRFNDCKNKRALPFDFYIPSINLTIEFDGEQHFKPKSKFDGEMGFAERVYNDAIKNAYCEDNNIKLLRIPYWELKNIKNILNTHINLE